MPDAEIIFEPLPGGREVARRGLTLIGDIVPDGFGDGGWAWRYDYRVGVMPEPKWFSTRADAREFIASSTP